MPDGADDGAREREAITKARRIVIKIGSRALSTEREIYDRLASGVAEAHAGAAQRRDRLERRHRARHAEARLPRPAQGDGAACKPPPRPGRACSCASTRRRSRGTNLAVAQVLLTHADLADRTRANNARDALAALLDAKVVPIINENDTVAVDEIRFGDNDKLAAMVTPLVSADVLLLLSDVTGLLDAKGERVRVVRNVTREARPLVTGATSTSGPAAWPARSKPRGARRSPARP